MHNEIKQFAINPEPTPQSSVLVGAAPGDMSQEDYRQFE